MAIVERGVARWQSAGRTHGLWRMLSFADPTIRDDGQERFAVTDDSDSSGKNETAEERTIRRMRRAMKALTARVETLEAKLGIAPPKKGEERNEDVGG